VQGFGTDILCRNTNEKLQNTNAFMGAADQYFRTKYQGYGTRPPCHEAKPPKPSAVALTAIN